MEKTLKIILASILGLITAFLGETLIFAKIIFILVVIDVITGMIASKYFRLVDLTTKRFVLKIRELGLFGVGLASFIVSDPVFQHVGLSALWAAKFFCCSYAFYELFSILENLGDMGLPVAKQVKAMLKAKLPADYKMEEVKNDK